MRYYLIIGKLGIALKGAIPIFEKEGDFQRIGLRKNKSLNWHQIRLHQPELVLMNLDDPTIKVLNVFNKLNQKSARDLHHIGFTQSKEKGFDALKAGFSDVICPPSTEDIVAVLTRYRITRTISPIYSVGWPPDYYYINIKQVILLKADNYTCIFYLKNGKRIQHHKTLKATYQNLPSNFQRINKSWAVNAFYVYRIHMLKKLVYLRHNNEALSISKKYEKNIVTIKNILTNLS